MGTKTLNVRCCCTPGLVLGRLPDVAGPSGVFPVPVPVSTDPCAGQTVAKPEPSAIVLAKDEAYGFVRGAFVWRELAWNSDHRSMEDLAQIPQFELVCNIPELESLP